MTQALLTALRPIQHILSDTATEDLAIQEPGVGWWLKGGAWHRTELPAMTYQRLHGLSVMAAAQTRQKITHGAPILSADLPGGLRLQSVMPPAVPAGTMALTIRRGDERVDEPEDVPRLYKTDRWNKWTNRLVHQQEQDSALLAYYDADDFQGFMRGLIDARKTGFLCGKTGAGKSRMSRLLGGMVPLHRRVITIEDAAELVVRQPNHIRHFYSADATENGLTPSKLMKAALRERPDLILLGEMRDPEAASVFVDEVMSGHEGSISTLHGKTPAQAARRLMNYLKGSRLGSSMQDATVSDMLGCVVDFIIPVENDGGDRSIGEVWFAADARRRGETFADLLAAP